MVIGQIKDWSIEWSRVGGEYMAIFTSPRFASNVLYTYEQINEILGKNTDSVIAPSAMEQAVQMYKSECVAH